MVIRIAAWGLLIFGGTLAIVIMSGPTKGWTEVTITHEYQCTPVNYAIWR